MSQEIAPLNERSRFFVLVLTLINTVFVAVLAGLQSDANIRADTANIQSQYYAVQVSAELVRQGQQSAYDFATLSARLKNAQEALVLQFSALELENNDNAEGAARLRVQAAIAQARADAAQSLSIFYTDPRYAPANPDSAPDLQRYLAEQAAAANAIVEKQNAAADAYQRWNGKSDSYLTALTVLSLAFFLLGVAQTTRRLRIFFAVAAVSLMLACGLWTLAILLA